MTNPKNIRAGVVGIGKMGLLHMSILSSMSNVKVVALCDKSKLITKFAKKALPNLTIVNSVEQLNKSNLDVVYVTTPIPSHFKIIEKIYKEKLASNVFVEKTLAFSLEQAQEICTLAEKSGGVNMVGYERRFAVTFNKAHELIGNGALGDIVRFKAYAYSSDFLSLDPSKAQKASLSRGGLLRDLCSHAIDLSIWFFGDLKVSSKTRVEINLGFQHSLAFDVVNRDSVAGLVEASWCKKGYRLPEIGLEIIGIKGTIKVNDDQVIFNDATGTKTKWYRLNLKDNVDLLLGAPEYYRESKKFIDCITNDCNTEPNFKTALKVEQVIEQAKQSNY